MGYEARERVEAEAALRNWFIDTAGLPAGHAHGIAHCLADRPKPTIKRRALVNVFRSQPGEKDALDYVTELIEHGIVELVKGDPENELPGDVFILRPPVAADRSDRPADSTADPHSVNQDAPNAVLTAEAPLAAEPPAANTAPAWAFQPKSTFLAQRIERLDQAPVQAERNMDKLHLLDEWLAQAEIVEPAPATVTQRAYEIFNDEKALGPHLDSAFSRLLKRLDIGKGELRIANLKQSTLVSYIPYGSRGPVLVVENGDTFDSLRYALRTKGNARILGQQIGGVVYGAGTAVCTPGLLDQTLASLGYTLDYVLYWGDIDRSGVTEISRAREANNVQIRLARPFYQKMVQLQKARVRRGIPMEPSGKQSFPEHLDEIAREVPLFARWIFLRTIRSSERIPQEIVSLEYLLES